MIALSGHPFTAAALAQYVDQAAREITLGSTGLLKAAVDAEGVRVVLVFALTASGSLKFETAFAHDWRGANSFGASGSFSFGSP